MTVGGTSIEGIYANIVAVAEALGVPDEAEKVIAGLKDRVARVHHTLKEARAPRPRVLLVEWTSPMYVAGHWGPEQVYRAGGRDVLDTVGAHSVTVDMKQLKQADPEIVLIAPCGYSLANAVSEAKALLAHDDWQWLAGRQVWALDANELVCRPGPRIIEGLETMARIFNPTLFSGIDPTHAQRVS